MIFLFNSSSRRDYLENIFATLHFPYGMVNRYQYPCEENYSFVDDSIKQNCSIGDDVIISFVDKYANNTPVYLPLRKAELVNVEEKDGRIYIDVKLLDCCHATDDVLYSDFIEHCFNGRIYHKEGDDRWKGVLAIKKDIDASYLITIRDDSWITTVKKLSGKKLFLDNYSIFTKIHVVDKENKELEIIQKDNEYGYLLKSEEKYVIKLSYYINEYNQSPMTKIHASIDDSQNICGIVLKELEIGNKHSEYNFPLQIKSVDRLQSTSIRIRCREEKIENKNTIYAVKPLNIFVDSKINSKLKAVLIGICVLALGISTWVSTLPIESIIKDAETIINSGNPLGKSQSMIYNLSLFLNDCRYFYNAICSGIGAVSTFGLVYLYGKPEL